jgi:hypothetical protein|tara:strand:+ start:1014 stop:1247 length:234 start_codon:yes stop_codon:yes gene_type:complete
MTEKEILKLMEVQYLKGRLDELYKGYVPYSIETNNRIIDTRISKYENKLKQTDESAYIQYMLERENLKVLKNKNEKM